MKIIIRVTFKILHIQREVHRIHPIYSFRDFCLFSTLKSRITKILGIQPKYSTLYREIESFEVLKRVQSALSRTTSGPLMNSLGGALRGGDGSLNHRQWRVVELCVLSPRGLGLRINFEIWSSSLELILSKLSTLFNSQDFQIQNFLRFLRQTSTRMSGTGRRHEKMDGPGFSKC